MFVLGLLTCVVLRAFSAQAKVVTGFKDECEKFFYKDIEPGGMDQNARRICQVYYNRGVVNTYYATLYSVHHRIPLYSAYTFNPDCMNDNRRPTKWHVEPQISGYTTEHMVLETDLRDYNEATIKASQAMSSDYSDTGYDRGHLNPNSFSCNDGRTATFTLTNAAPMDPCFNRIHWYNWEKTLRKFLSNKLGSDGGSATAYIVTGTVPDVNVWIPQREISDDPERVSVPSHIWTAVCYKHQSDEEKSFSFGYIGENKPEEPDIKPISVSDLNDQLTDLYSTHSGTQQSVKVSIFVDDCFGDNYKLKKVKEGFKKIMNPRDQEVQISSGVQTTLGAVKRASEHNVNVREVRAKLGFGNMDTYYTMAEDLKVFAGSACVITHVKSTAKTNGYDDLRKRDVSEGSDAVECLLVPEKQKTAADGSPCSSVSESSTSCECTTEGKTKPCCSSPCLYQDNLKGYWCNSGQTPIECSPRYSLITVKGKKCMDGYPCATYGYDYYWCYTGVNDENFLNRYEWDYCSPPLRQSRAKNGKYCLSNRACAKYGSKKPWCYTDDNNNWDYCCKDCGK
ncbi:uncharacterized protein [Pseudorasbora parva]|uniref:uncharacterized protein n=1 Tax=Pseudorasbora parva TaxID=51549 RepID=UPI00351E51A5